MTQRREKRSRWGLFLLFWTLLLLMLGFLGCLFFFKYASDYEQTRPEKAMDAIMADMSEEDWRAALSPTARGVGEFEDASALYDSYFDSTIKGKEFSYRRDMSRSDTTQTVFVVYAGTTRVGEVRLVPSGDKLRFGFGRSDWTLESITSTSLSSSLQALTVQIDAPDGVTPCLNGVSLGQERIVDPAVTLDVLSDLERRFSDAAMRMVRYEVSPLYGQITVTDGEGEEIAPLGEPNGGVVRYVIMPKQTYSFRVVAPEGVKVTVCGAELGEAEIVGRDGSLFRKLEDFLPEGGYETLTYAYDGLYSEPLIRAEYRGEELAARIDEDGTYSFFYPDDEDISIAMHEAVEGFFEAYMNYANYKYNGVALRKLTDRVLPGTELYSYFKNSHDAMVWASATETDGQELRFESFHRVGENCFTCMIFNKADYTATQWHGTESYAREDGYQMVFIRQNGNWLAAVMSALE